MKRLFFLFVTAIMLANCSKDEPQQLLQIDPSDPEALSNEITFTSSTTEVPGVLPAPSASPSAPVITNASSASVVASGTVYLPITFTSTIAPSTLLIQVVGATTFYFSIPLPGTVGANGTVTIPMTISSRVLTGSFTMAASVVSSGEISQPFFIPASVTEPLACGNGYVSGTEGVTNTRHNLSGVAGNVVISYDTYTVPDRVDVFIDGTQWSGGTGSSISPPPPTSNCASPLPGFVGAAGTITVPVTAANKYIDVYVSGCLGSGTAWDYSLTCP